MFAADHDTPFPGAARETERWSRTRPATPAPARRGRSAVAVVRLSWCPVGRCARARSTCIGARGSTVAWSCPERFVSQAPQHCVARGTLASALPTPPVRFVDLTLQHIGLR